MIPLRIPDPVPLYDAKYFNEVWRAFRSWSAFVGAYDQVVAAAISTRTLTASGNVGITDGAVFVDTTAGNVTITLPAVSTTGIGGREFVVKRLTGGGNTLTVTTADSKTIDGAATVSMGTQWMARRFRTDGVSWYITGAHL